MVAPVIAAPAAANPILGGFLLSFYAAGATYSLYESNQNQKLIDMGKQLQQSAYETNLEAIRNQTEQASLDEMKELRKNVANQIVNNAARGVSNAGSAWGNVRESETAYAKDEKARRMNLLTSESQLRANNILSGLHTLQSETQLGQSITGQIFNSLPVSSLVNKYAPDTFDSIGKTFKNLGKKAGFGLEPV